MPIVADAAIAIRGDMSQFNRDLAGAGKTAEGLGGKLSGLLSPKNLLIGAGVLAAAGPVLDFMGGAVDAASNLNETISKTGQIFGEEALPGLEAWAEGAADALGQSKQDALDAASTFATFGKSAGLAGNDLTGFATKLTGLSSDLASFYNTSPEDAVQAIGAALRGESEPIRRYGVLLNEATLKQRAMALGIIKTTTEALTPQQKVLAAQAEILAQTSDAQGDFARTSDGLANTQRTNSAKMEDAMAKIGESLLPLVTMLAELGGHIIPVFADAINILLTPIRALNDAFETAGEVTDNFALDFGDMGDRIHRIADRAEEDFQAVKDFIQEDMEATGHSFEEAAEAADEHFGTISDSTDDLVEQSGQAWDTYQSQIASSGDKAVTAVRGFQGTILQDMEEGRVHVVEIAMSLPGAIANGIDDNLTALDDAVAALHDAITNPFDPLAEEANALGVLASQELADGLASNNVYIHDRAVEAYEAAHAVLAQTGAYEWGRAIAKAWADGVASRWGYAHAKAVYLGTSLSGPLKGESPPKEGPLKDIDKWGANVGQAWADGLTSAANAGIVNLASPSLPPMSMAGAIPGVAAGTSIVYELNVNGVQRTVDSAEQAIDELNAMGAFSEGRL